jgi:hypothetical protein
MKSSVGKKPCSIKEKERNGGEKRKSIEAKNAIFSS